MAEHNSTEEDIKAHQKNLSLARSLTQEQINFLCDGGWYNDTIRGYLILAARNAGYNRKQTDELLTSLRYVLETENKMSADDAYRAHLIG